MDWLLKNKTTNITKTKLQKKPKTKQKIRVAQPYPITHLHSMCKNIFLKIWDDLKIMRSDSWKLFFLLSRIQSLSKSVIVESISTLKLHYLDSFFARDGRNFFSFRSARGSARAPEISSDLNSVRKIDDFCTKNEFKIFKTCF